MQRRKQQRSKRPKATRSPNKKPQEMPPELTDEQIKKEIEREANRKPEFIRPDPASYKGGLNSGEAQLGEVTRIPFNGFRQCNIVTLRSKLAQYQFARDRYEEERISNQ